MNQPEPDWLQQWRSQPVSMDAGLAHFDALPAVSLDEMRGRWRGVGLHSGHPLDGLLELLGWYGKCFLGNDSVDPLLFQDAKGEVVAIDPTRAPIETALAQPGLARSDIARKAFQASLPALKTTSPKARLRKMEHRGVVSAAMIYDSKPIIDHFRRIDADRLLGLMDLRPTPQPFFFLLERDLGG